jgi:hypothetical protein
MEKDDELAGEGNSYTAQFWQYDSRIARRWNIDPVVKHHESPYAAFANNPIIYIDPLGSDTIDVVSRSLDHKGRSSTDDGFEGKKMLHLFTAFIDNDTDDRYELSSDVFLSQFHISGGDKVTHTYNGRRVVRENAKVIWANTESTLFWQAVSFLDFQYLNSERARMIQRVEESSGTDWMIKLSLFTSNEEGDIKSNWSRLVWLNGVGLLENDFVGNVFYASVWSRFQNLENTVWDGNELQNQWEYNGFKVSFGLDDPIDSKALIGGHLFAKTGLSINTFRSLNSIHIDGISRVMGNAVYHDYEINTKNGPIQFKSKSYW